MRMWMITSFQRQPARCCFRSNLCVTLQENSYTYSCETSTIDTQWSRIIRGASLVKEGSCKIALDRSRQLQEERSCQLREHSRSFSNPLASRALSLKIKWLPLTNIHSFWQQFWVTFLILVTQILFIYCQLTNFCQQQVRKNDRTNTLEQTKSQFVYKQTRESHD